MKRDTLLGAATSKFRQGRKLAMNCIYKISLLWVPAPKPPVLAALATDSLGKCRYSQHVADV